MKLPRRIYHVVRQLVLVVVEVSVQDHDPIPRPVQQPLGVIATYNMEVVKIYANNVCVALCVCVYVHLFERLLGTMARASRSTSLLFVCRCGCSRRGTGFWAGSHGYLEPSTLWYLKKVW